MPSGANSSAKSAGVELVDAAEYLAGELGRRGALRRLERPAGADPLAHGGERGADRVEVVGLHARGEFLFLRAAGLDAVDHDPEGEGQRQGAVLVVADLVIDRAARRPVGPDEVHPLPGVERDDLADRLADVDDVADQAALEPVGHRA